MAFTAHSRGQEKRLPSQGAFAHSRGGHCFCFRLAPESGYPDDIKRCCYCGKAEDTTSSGGEGCR